MRKCAIIALLISVVAFPLPAQTVVCCSCAGSGGGSGTVTSVAASVPPYMSVTGSPITTTGTLDFSFASQSAGEVFAAPCGTAGVPLFRAICEADVPDLPQSRITGLTAALDAKQATGDYITSLTGDVTATGPGAAAATLATVNANVGSFTSANITVDAKGRITAAANGASSGLPVADTTAIVTGSADATKVLRFEVDGFTTGTTRVATPPDSNFTMARTDAAQTFTGLQTFSTAPTSSGGTANSERYGAGATTTNVRSVAIGTNAGAGGDGTSIGYNAQTPGIGVSIGASSNAAGQSSVAIGRAAVTSSGHMASVVLGDSAVTTAARQFVVGGTQSGSGAHVTDVWIGAGVTGVSSIDVSSTTYHTTQAAGTDRPGGTMRMLPGGSTGIAAGGDFIVGTVPSLAASGTTLNTTAADRFMVRAKAISLTDGSANNVTDISLPALSAAGGQVFYSITATDGTDVQDLSGTVSFRAVNKAGAYTVAVTDDALAAVASAGTLTASWALVGGTNKVTLQVTPDTSLTATTFRLYWTVINNSERTMTPY